MNTPLKTQHNGIEITYNDDTNLWLFEVRGRERKVESLVKAREIIDKPEPKEKPPFTRVKAHTERSYQGSGFQTVEVTSIADSPGYREAQYWVSLGNGKRQKISYYSIFPVNENNDALVARIRSIDDQRENLGKQRDALVKKLSCMPEEK